MLAALRAGLLTRGSGLFDYGRDATPTSSGEPTAGAPGLARVQDPMGTIGPSGRRSHHRANRENTAGSPAPRRRRRSPASGSRPSRGASSGGSPARASIASGGAPPT